MTTNGIFITEDLFLAAALKTAGLKFLEVSQHGQRGIFKFQDSAKRESIVTNFYGGNLTQNIRTYVDNWMAFKRLVSGAPNRQ